MDRERDLGKFESVARGNLYGGSATLAAPAPPEGLQYQLSRLADMVKSFHQTVERLEIALQPLQEPLQPAGNPQITAKVGADLSEAAPVPREIERAVADLVRLREAVEIAIHRLRL